MHVLVFVCLSTVVCGSMLSAYFFLAAPPGASERSAHNGLVRPALLVSGKTVVARGSACQTRFCICKRYAERRTPAARRDFDDRGLTDEIYAYGREVVNLLLPDKGSVVVADFGAGADYKLSRAFNGKGISTVGYEVDPVLSFLRPSYPSQELVESNFRFGSLPRADVVMSVDVVAHIVNPDLYMLALKRFQAQFYIVSSVDRNCPPMNRAGPPNNVYHVREWSIEELVAYCETSGFVVLDARRNAVMPEQCTVWLLLALPR